jgi:hypothetical protein
MIRAKWMNPMNITSSFSNREKMRLKPLSLLNRRSISFRRRYMTLLYSQGSKRLDLGGHNKGNGRLSRLLSQLMALQAGLPLLNFSVIKGKQREAYFAAVRSGMWRDYAPMIEAFSKVVKASS